MIVSAIFDSDILIDVSRNVEEAIAFTEDFERQGIIGISIMTEMELITGCQNKRELNRIMRFLERFQIIPFDSTISYRAVALLRKYRLSHTLLTPDALIAATAISHNLSFATKNQRDFKFIEGLNLLPYPPE